VHRRTLGLLFALLAVAVVFAATPAQGRRSTPRECGSKPYSYAGLESRLRAHGVSTTLSPLAAPAVRDGHVAGWVGVGGTTAGPGGVAQWIQVGLFAFSKESESRMYYEVTIAGSKPRFVELSSPVKPGERHDFAVLEMAGRKSWWRAWVDNTPVSPPIYLPGSHGVWHPQVVGESWNGNTGACNRFAYKFSNVRLAHSNGGSWRVLRKQALFEDAGYRVVQTARGAFVAASR
jgi:hypothetical protein